MRCMCARDFVYDMRRALLRRAKHETSVGGQEILRTWDVKDLHLRPEQTIMQQAFWNLSKPHLDVLSSETCRMLLGQCIQGRTVKELTKGSGRTEGTIEQALLRARRLLRSLLKRAGLAEAGLLETISKRC